MDRSCGVRDRAGWRGGATPAQFLERNLSFAGRGTSDRAFMAGIPAEIEAALVALGRQSEGRFPFLLRFLTGYGS